MKWGYSILASAVVTASSWGMVVLVEKIPSGAPRDAAERFVLAPGQEVLRRLEGQDAVERLRKSAKKEAKKGEQALDRAADAVDSALEEYDLDAGLGDARKRVRKLSETYSVASWAVVGFLACSLLTLIMGVSSMKTALALGFKVTLAMIFLQAALVFGGVLIYQRYS